MQAIFFPKRATEILLENLTALPIPHDAAPACIAHKPFRIYSLGKYEQTLWHALIYEIKFYKNNHAITLLAPHVSAAVRSLAPYSTLIIPIPLHPARERDRGFNQVSVVLEAARMHQMNDVADLRENILMRTLQRKQQKTLNRTKREENISGSFEVNLSKLVDIAQQDILLVDDVCATGSTVREAAKTLMQAGAQSVTILAFCNS